MSIAWGSKEYCESVKDQIEKLLEERHGLVIIEGSNTMLEVKQEKVTEPESEPVPEWFRNLPIDEQVKEV